jgi:hypothetical protein
MVRTEYEANLPATFNFAYGGLITIEDCCGDTVRFIIQRERICQGGWAVDSDEIVPRLVAAQLVMDRQLLHTETV